MKQMQTIGHSLSQFFKVATTNNMSNKNLGLKKIITVPEPIPEPIPESISS